MKNILVTGGAGFIGANFILHMLSKHSDISVINYDALTYAAALSNLDTVANDSRYAFIEGDICEYEKVCNIIKQYKIDTLVNFAAESHVDRAIYGAEVFAQTNIMGTLNLLQAAKDVWKEDLNDKFFMQISTDEVYGSANNGQEFCEDSRLMPGNPYAASKAAADMLCLSWHNTYKFPVAITRSSNNFGRFQHKEKFIPQVIKKALGNEAIAIYGDGKNLRDWLSVHDNVAAIEGVILKGKAGEIYNICAHNEMENIELAKKIIDIINGITGKDLSYNLLKYVKDRKGHDFRYLMSTHKIEREIGWRAKEDFSSALYNTILWYIENS